MSPSFGFVWQRYGSVIVMSAIALLFVAVWFMIPTYSSRGATARCPSSFESEFAPVSENVVPVPLTPENPEGVVINFGRERGVHSRTVYLQRDTSQSPPEEQGQYAAFRPDTVYRVSERTLERQELEGGIGPARYVSTARVTANKDVALTVCVDSTGETIDPGTYVGNVTITGRGIQPETVPVQVSFQYAGYRWIVPLFSVITLIGGSWLVWASHKRAEESSPETSLWRRISDFPGWMVNNLISIAPAIAATVTVLLAKYWRSPAWGAKAPEDWISLLGFMFTAYTTTLTAGTAIVGPRHATPSGGSSPTARSEAAETVVQPGEPHGT